MKEISVFGENAREIEEGQVFKAIKYSVEGRDCVKLIPIVKYDKDGCPYNEVRLE